MEEPRADPLPPGFDDVEPLTTTGCGQVYRARVATADGRTEQVAVTLVPTPVRDRGARRRLRGDCLAAAALNAEPGVLAVRDLAFTEDNRPLLITDLPQYGNLADRLEHGGPLRVAEVVATGLALARALTAAHRAGVLHLGIAPDVVFSGPDGPVLGFFGLAWAVRPPTQPDIPAEAIVHAPRELFGWEEPTVGSDVYGLASVLRTAITGRAPFLAEARIGRAALYHRLVQGAPPPLQHPGVPAELATLLDRMLVPDPARRPGLDEVVAVLGAVSMFPGFAAPGRVPVQQAPAAQQPTQPALVPGPMASGTESNALAAGGGSSNVEYLAKLMSAPPVPAPFGQQLPLPTPLRAEPEPAPAPAPAPAPVPEPAVGDGRRGRNTGLILLVAAGAAALAAGVAWGVATGDRHQNAAAQNSPVVVVQTFEPGQQAAYQVSGIRAQALGTSVTVTWSAPAKTDGISSYVIVAGLHDKDVKDTTVGAGTYSATITGLRPGTQYCFSVITLAHPPGDSSLRMAKPTTCYQATTGNEGSPASKA